MTPVDADKVISGIQRALGSKRVGKRWVSNFLSKLNPSDLARAVETNLDVWGLCVEEFSLGSPGVQPLASLLLKVHWREIEDELTDVNRIHRRLARKKANHRVLERPEAKHWLNRTAERAYNCLYYYTWGVQTQCPFCLSAFKYFPIEWVEHGRYLTVCPRCGAEVPVSPEAA